MAVSKAKKIETLEQYNELFEKAKSVIITQYGGMTMKDMDKVRKSLRDVDAEFHVTKNTLALRALKNKGYDVPEKWLTGATAVAFCFKDTAAVAKNLGTLGKDIDKLSYAEVLSRDLKVMDGAAIALARDNALPVIVFSIEEPGNLLKALRGQARHTVIQG